MLSLTLFDSYKTAVTAWGLSKDEEEMLLAATIREINQEWSDEMFKRALYVISIFTDLQSLFVEKEQANVWVHRKNTRFGKRSAIEVMLTEQDGLEQVAKYLKAKFF
jgi:uncharacterized protein (DUF2384 family)